MLMMIITAALTTIIVSYYENSRNGVNRSGIVNNRLLGDFVLVNPSA